MGMELEPAAEKLLEAMSKLKPEGSEEYKQEVKKIEEFQREFEELVKKLKAQGVESLKPFIIDMVKRRFGTESGPSVTTNTINPQGVVIFGKGKGEMTIKTHKEFL